MGAEVSKQPPDHDDRAGAAIERTVTFADMSGFTASTEVHGDQAAATLAMALVDCANLALGASDVLVKAIGDAVMLSSVDPVSATELVRRLLDTARSVERFPRLRVGMHHGPVVETGGDLFGSTVNTAARVAALAKAGQVLVTSVVAEALIDSSVERSPIGAVELRDVINPVSLWNIGFGEDDPRATIDPVCLMRLTPTHVEARWFDGVREWQFCSTECRGRFRADPQRYERRRG